MAACNEQQSPEALAEDTKNAFKKLGKSVCLLTCLSDGQRHVSVATAVCNVSNNPPSLLVCVEKTASMAALLAEDTRFAVNVPGANQQDIVEHCMSSKGADRFGKGTWQAGPGELPLLQDSEASFCCRVAERHDFATHHIVVASIEQSQSSDTSSGLIFLGGQFHAVA